MIRSAVLGLLFAGVTAAAAEAQVPVDLAKATTIATTVCVACHGVDGNSVLTANPILAGQGAEYIFKQLTEFKAAEGKPAIRVNAVMNGMASTLSESDMKGLALYYSQQKRKPSAATDEKLVAAGRTLWRKGDFERGIPACAGCHGPAGAGVPVQYPALWGQHAEYTEAQLKNFRSEERSNDAQRMMRAIADKLSDKQIRALADYIAGLR
jgi:cytochrome c553